MAALVRVIHLIATVRMFLDTKPVIRYPIAAALAGAGWYALKVYPNIEPAFITFYVIMTGMLAWELSCGFFIAIAILVVFKFLAKLPLVALLAIMVAALFLLGG